MSKLNVAFSSIPHRGKPIEMARRPSQTVVDYVVVGIAPALIMALVGSLAFFIIEVGYSGQFSGRLKYVSGFFVMGAVLITRIAIDIDKQRAQLYGLALAAVTFAAVMRFIDASVLFDFILIAVIWWTAHRLTYDCTVIEDNKQASGEGLLQTMGLEDTSTPDPNADSANRSSSEGEKPRVVPDDNDSDDFASMWDRFVKRRKKHHSPGITVVYFSAAALPIFGLGQIALMAQGRGHSASAYRYLFLYVASALALLMATSFLQLRRYLRQRRLQMPVEITGAWLGTGAILIVVVMIACLVMPRPTANSSLLRSVKTLASRQGLSPSKWGFGSDGPNDQEKASKEVTDPDSDQIREGDEGEDGDKESPKAKGEENGTGESSEQEQGSQSTDDPESDTRTRNKPQSDKDSESTDEPKERDETDKDRRQSSERGESDQPDQDSADDSPASQSPSNPTTQIVGALQNLQATIQMLLRLGYYVLIAAVVVYIVIRYRNEIGKAWAQFWRDIRKLFGRPAKPKAKLDELELPQPTVVARRFTDFRNPFQTGMAQKVSIAELIRYTFDAMEAWATDQNCAREEGQTPAEFAFNVAHQIPDVAPQVKLLAAVYNQAAYSSRSVGDCRKQLAALWQRMSA